MPSKRMVPEQEVSELSDEMVRLAAAKDAEIASEREARWKCEAALRAKDQAMSVLFERLRAAGVDCSDLIS